MKNYIYFTLFAFLITTSTSIAMNPHMDPRFDSKDLMLKILEYWPQSNLCLCNAALYRERNKRITSIKFSPYIPLQYFVNIVYNRQNALSLDIAGNPSAKALLIFALERGRLPLLQKLNLSGTNVTSQELSTMLTKCPNLTELTLEGCNECVNGVLIAINNHCCLNLQKLNLTMTFATAEQIQFILCNCPELTELLLEGCFSSASGIVSALDNDKAHLLKKLDLTSSRPSPQDINTILRRCSMLENLNLAQCKNAISGIILALDPDETILLQTLGLQWTDATAEDIEYILCHCPNLIDLDVSYCENSTQGIINALKRGFSLQLQRLNLKATDATAEDIEYILCHCPDLIDLDVSCCINSTQGIINALKTGSGLQLQRLILQYINVTDEQKETILKLLNA